MLAAALYLTCMLAHDRPADAFDALKAEYDAAVEMWERDYDPSRWGDEANASDKHVEWFIERYEKFPMWDYAPRFLELGRQQPAADSGRQALEWLINQAMHVPVLDHELYPKFCDALALYLEHHRNSPRLARACRGAGWQPSPGGERFLRAILDDPSIGRAARGHAYLALAELLANRRIVALNPWFDPKPSDRFQAFIASRLDDVYVQYIKSADAPALGDEADRLFQRTIDKFGDVLAATDIRELLAKRENLAQKSRRSRLDLLQLTRGRPAPEIEGKDADGLAFKLSDYRGKVVVLTFSGNWCGPCREMYPHERALVTKYKDMPFALLSVNTDEDVETLRKSIAVGEITWRCWWDGGTEGPITTAWAVRGFPSVYVIGPDGVILDRALRGEQLDAAIGAALRKLNR